MERFALRRVDPALDLDAIHAWMNDPDVARFWSLAVPRYEIAAYLASQLDNPHSTPYVGCLDGRPMSYWELYRADLDPLSSYYDARPHDAGVHLLLGPPGDRGRGVGARLLRHVAQRSLAQDSAAKRVIAEPDVRNVASIRAFERAGFRRERDLDLPEKRAALMVLERGKG